MKYSQVFPKTLREAPKDAETVNHKLLVRGGYVRQLMAGVYTYMPLGQRVLNNISQIIREEMNGIDSKEVLMPLLHPATIWKQSGGWDAVDVLFKIKSRTDKDYALAQSAEEVVTPLAREFVRTYKDLPLSLYQIQWKFRDELRSKAGILRGREFLMKDMYSWHLDQADFDRNYAIVKAAYIKVFMRLGLVAKVTEASGGAFTEKVSYEFEVLTDAGEANILYCDDCDFCVNVDDITTNKEGDVCARCSKGKLKPATAAELGNVFDLGQKYTKAFEFEVMNEQGEKVFPIMGCYGIGVTRTMGVIVEKFHDDRGIIWPKSIAPFQVHLASLNVDGEETYRRLCDAGIEVLWDDTDRSAGEKLADADLLGMPYRVVVSAKTGDKFEFKARNEKESTLVSFEELVRRIGQ